MGIHLILFSVSLFLTGVTYRLRDWVWFCIASAAAVANLGIAIYMI